MTISDIESRKRHKNYYRNNLRKMANFLMLLTLLIFFLASMIIYKYFTMPQPYYYATASSGVLTQLLTVPRGTRLKETRQT